MVRALIVAIMECSFTFLLLCFIALLGTFTTAHPTDIDEFWTASADILQHDELRHRRDTKEDLEFFLKKNHTFCFCGKQSWLRKLTLVDSTESAICALQSKLNITEDNDDFYSKFITTIKRSQCTYDCIFRELNLLSSDGQVNKPATKKLFTDKVFVEEGIKETADKVLDRCLTTGTGTPLSTDVVLRLAKGTNCDNEAYKFTLCLLYEMVEDCPHNLLRFDEPKCKTLYDKHKIGRQAAKDKQMLKL